MLNPLKVLPLHLACQLLSSQNESSFMNIAFDTGLPKLATEFPKGYIVVPDFGAAFKYHNRKVNWNVARKYCTSEGGYLAIVDSYEKLEFLMNMNKLGSHMHVGFHKLFGEDEWTDLKTGLPAAMIPWRSESFQGDGRVCTAMLEDKGGVAAIGCAEVYSFVCEISIFNN